MAALLSLAVAAARVVLGVHYPSDVVGGLLLGALTALALAGCLRTGGSAPVVEPAVADRPR